MERVLELYKKLLKVCKSIADEDGLVSVELVGDKEIKRKAVTIEGKRLALPTYENMKNNTNGDLVLFHPLNENIVKTTESPVLARFRKNIKVTLHNTILIIIDSLLKLAASVSDHKKLSADQGEILLLLKNVNEKTLKVFDDIFIKGDKEIEFIHLFTKSNGNINGVVYPKLCVVSFPFYEELLKAEKVFNGIKISSKEKETFLELFKFIFINVDKENNYNRGPVGLTAPTLGALMQSIKVLASEINIVINNYKDYIPYADDLLVNGDWVEEMEDIDSFKHLVYSIPMQSGNNGEVPKAYSPTQPTNRSSFANTNNANANLENMSREERIMMLHGGRQRMNQTLSPEQHGTVNALPSWRRQGNQNQNQYPQPNNYYPQQNQNNHYQQPQQYTNQYQQPSNNNYPNSNQGHSNSHFDYMNTYNL